MCVISIFLKGTYNRSSLNKNIGGHQGQSGGGTASCCFNAWQDEQGSGCAVPRRHNHANVPDATFVYFPLRHCLLPFRVAHEQEADLHVGSGILAVTSNVRRALNHDVFSSTELRGKHKPFPGQMLPSLPHLLRKPSPPVSTLNLSTNELFQAN